MGEADYDRIFTENPDIDNSPTRPGMQLNDMVMNRQRYSLLGKNLLRQHQLMRQEIANESIPRRKQPKKQKCSFCGIMKSAQLDWTLCKNKGCTFKYCPDCPEDMTRHEAVCGQRKRR